MDPKDEFDAATLPEEPDDPDAEVGVVISEEDADQLVTEPVEEEAEADED